MPQPEDKISADEKMHRRNPRDWTDPRLLVALAAFIFTVLSRAYPDITDKYLPKGLASAAAFLARFFWLFVSPLILWIAYKSRRFFFAIYRNFLLLVLRPVLPPAPPAAPPIPTPAPVARVFPSAFPFAVKLGTFEFYLEAGVVYRQGRFDFDAPFSEVPQVFISECLAGDWLSVKIDAKNEKGFGWAVRRANETREGDIPVRYHVRLQWFAIAPIRTLIAPGAQLVIESAQYGIGDLYTLSTNAIQAQVKHDVFFENCGNHLDGDPVVGTGKTLLLNYTYKGQPYGAVINELSPVRIPNEADKLQPRRP